MRSSVLTVVMLAPALSLAVVGAAGRVEAQERDGFARYDGASNLSVDRFVGLIEIETGGVDRVEAAWEPGEGLLDAPTFEVSGGKLEITQLRRRDDVDCRGGAGGPEVRVEGAGRHPLPDYGRLRVRLPAGADVEIGGGAVAGTVGDVGSLSLGIASCASLTVGDVAENAEVAVNGSGDLILGDVGGRLSLAVNGSGNIRAGAVGDGLEAAINGSGDVEIASVIGNVEAAINGSGGVHVLGGQARRIEAAIMGSGELRFDGTAESVDLAAFGSGDVYVSEVQGEVETASFGSGRVHVGQE